MTSVADPNGNLTSGSSDSPVTFLGDFSKKLVTNTFFNLVGRCWSFAVTIVLTPFILSHLNVGDFGTWILLSVFISSFNLLDLGLGSSLVKYISEYYTYEDFERINRVVFSGLLFYGTFGILLVMLGLAVERPLFSLFHITAASEVYCVVLVSCALANIAAMLLSVLKGIQRMDKSNSIEIQLSLLNAVGTVLFLQAGWGMFGLAVNALINVCCALILTWWTVRRVVPRISIGWHFDAGLVKEMFVYGTKIQVSRLGGLICFGGIDKLIISRFLGIASVSFYEVSSRLTSFMRAVPLVMISALIPATSELGARNDRARILQTYILASKYVAMITIAMVAFLILEARSVLTLWLGRGFEDSVILVQLLAIGYGVNVLGGAASQTGAGVGRPEFDMRSTLLLVILNPILSLLLVQKFGAAGAAAGTSLSLSIAAAYLLVIFHRKYVENSIGTAFNDVYLRPLLAGILANLAPLGFHQIVPQVAEWQEVRYLIPAKLFVDFGIFAPVYIVLLIALRQVTARDWRNFLGLIAFSFELLRHPFRERVKIYR
jgi:O-antigen/teichoic acid export membrane protein